MTCLMNQLCVHRNLVNSSSYRHSELVRFRKYFFQFQFPLPDRSRCNQPSPSHSNAHWTALFTEGD
ncbi:unnamed protein product [Ectocarpus sp. CCAP 1310/34]|nr:unnamed protein product [Ectocarpus sp. CCAP 1310/34]